MAQDPHAHFSGIDSTDVASREVECLKQHGVQFIGRYISPNTHNFPHKRITPEEAHELSGAGFLLFSIFEQLPSSDRQKALHFTRENQNS